MRKTIADLPRAYYDEAVGTVADRGSRRYHPFSFDFDTSSLSLAEIPDHWEEKVKEMHRENRERQLKWLEQDYGSAHLDTAIKNSVDLGPKSMSMLSHHNALHQQARRAFVSGSYYPALVAACALGERILNHLILDLRDQFKTSPHYKKVYRKDSFDHWPFVVDVLTDWKVLADSVATDFLALGELRNRSIHFNQETYKSLRDDSLSALKRLDGILAKQFGFFGRQPWFIEGTAGAQFIKRSYENEPFVRTYLVPRSGFVGPLYGMDRTPQGQWSHLDYVDYGDAELSDEEFARAHSERNPEKVVTREMIDRLMAAAPSEADPPAA